MHMAIGAVVNALWDLKAKRAGRAAVAAAGRDDPRGARRPRRLPLPHRRAHAATRRWRSCGPPSPAAPSGASELLRDGLSRRTRPRPAGSATTTRSSRGCAARRSPTASTQIKLKVGADLDDDVRRLRDRARGRRARRPRSPSTPTSAGTSPRRSRGCSALAPYDLAWIEEPTSPDDVLGHAAIARGVAPIPVATGEHVANRVMFKQLLQAGRDGGPADRRRPRRRRQRERRDPAARRQVRRARLPARGRRRPVRGGAAPGDVRLRRRLRHAWRAG